MMKPRNHTSLLRTSTRVKYVGPHTCWPEHTDVER